MYSSEIRRILERDDYAGAFFGGVFPSDLFPSELEPSRIYIRNTARSTEPGTHWQQVSTLHAPNYATFFDSYGQPPSEELIPSLLSVAPVAFYSDVPLQTEISIVCGHYVSLISLLEARGYSLLEILLHFPSSSSSSSSSSSTTPLLPYITNDVYVHQTISSLERLKDPRLLLDIGTIASEKSKNEPLAPGANL